jgi:hypothetical protein
VKTLALGFLISLMALAGCAATDNGKDAVPGNDTSGGEVSLDGYVPDGGDAVPGLDTLGDALPDVGDGVLTDVEPADGSTDNDLGGWQGDLVEDVPTGFSEVFESESCQAYCEAMVTCELALDQTVCVADCGAQLNSDPDFGVRMLCILGSFYENQAGCAAVAACAEAQIYEGCRAPCTRVGECGLYEPPMNDMWGNTVDECLISCSGGVNSENFEADLACLNAALETCSILAVVECFEGDLKQCDDLCSLASISNAEAGFFGAPCLENGDCASGYCVDSSFGKFCSQTCLDSCPDNWSCESLPDAQPDPISVCIPASVSGCDLIGADRLFADNQACLDWCAAQQTGPTYAARACVDMLDTRDYFGFERPASCAEMATEACFPADVALPPGALAFTEAFAALCEVEGGEIPLPEILAWHVVGILEAANLLNTADFYEARDCLEAFETCPGESGWLTCFVPTKWEHSEALCTSVVDCMTELEPGAPPQLTLADCLFVTSFHQTYHAAELADIWTCVQAAGEVCLDVKACVTGDNAAR